jgi:hypothetical protein
MICYILIIFSLLLVYYYTIEKKEHFIEKCYKNISNKMKNGTTKYFDNTLIDTIYSDYESNIQHKTDIQVLDVLPSLKDFNLNKNSSNKKWEEHNDLYTKYKYNMEGIFNDLHQKVDNKKKEIESKKMDLDSKLMVIQDKSNSIIKKSNNEGIENRLKPAVLLNINNEINKKTLNLVRDSSFFDFINRTELNSLSNAYNWQYIEDNNTPVRINAKTGKVECYSVDNIKCETDYRNKHGNNMYHIDNAKEIDCEKDSNELCNLEKKILDKYPDIYDYKSCPKGWSHIKKNICKAPSSFTKNINNKYINDPNCKTNTCIDLNQPLEKLIEYTTNDDIKFKNKINASAIIKQKNDIDRNITKKINSIMGNTDQVSKADLGNSNYFKKGILTRIYNVVNNVKGSSLRHQLLSSNINFNWSASNVLGITSKYTELNNIFIEFLGYIQIPKDITQIKLRLGSDSKAILYLSTESDKLDVSVAIDRSEAVSYDKTESGILSVKQDSYIPFKLVYHDNDLESKLHLEWAIGENAKEKTNSYEIIASSYFFVNVSECEDSIKMESLNNIKEFNNDVKGRFVRITIKNKNRDQNWLQLAEVQVMSNNKNIALNKSSSSSGNYATSTNSRANDGNTDGNWDNRSVYHSGTGLEGGAQYWEVDLGNTSQVIDRVIVHNRTDCCGGRLSNWLLSIYDNSKNIIWARIYRDPPNPNVSIDIKPTNNNMDNINIEDYY